MHSNRPPPKAVSANLRGVRQQRKMRAARFWKCGDVELPCMTTEETDFSPRARTLAILCGALLWAALFGFAGAMTQRAWIGATCGAGIGAIIGYGFTKNLIGRVVVWVSVMGLLGAVIGPGYDADACTSAVGWAVIGSLLGWFGWTGVLMLVFGMLGTGFRRRSGRRNWGGCGHVVWAVSAWFAIYLDKLIAVKDSRDICNVPSSGKPPEDSAGT